MNQLEQGLAHKTDAAASQGAVDVEAAKASATGYVEQAKNLASGAFATAQVCTPHPRPSDDPAYR